MSKCAIILAFTSVLYYIKDKNDVVFTTEMSEHE